MDLLARVDTRSTMVAFHRAFLTITRYDHGRESDSPSAPRRFDVHCNIRCRIGLRISLYSRRRRGCEILSRQLIEDGEVFLSLLFFDWSRSRRRRCRLIVPLEREGLGNIYTENVLSRESEDSRRWPTVFPAVCAANRRDIKDDIAVYVHRYTSSCTTHESVRSAETRWRYSDADALPIASSSLFSGELNRSLAKGTTEPEKFRGRDEDALALASSRLLSLAMSVRCCLPVSVSCLALCFIVALWFAFAR